MFDEVEVILHSEIEEQSLLGCILLEPKLIDKTSDKIDENDFYVHKHKLIYRAMILNKNDNILNDIATLVTRLQQLKVLKDVGDVNYISELNDMIPSTANFETYMNTIIDMTDKRYMLEKANMIIKYIEKYDSKEISRYAQEKFNNIRIVSNDEISFMNDEVDEYLEYLDTPMMSGKETLYPTLDEMLLIKDTDLITVAGRPGSGKSTFKSNLINNYCRQGYYVTDISLEMDKNSNKNRIYANVGEVRNLNIQRKNLTSVEKDRIREAVKQTKDYKLNIYDKPMTVEHICNYAKVLKQQDKLDILFIDHALLVDTQKQLKRNEQVNYITWKLKSLAMELKIPVILLTQLSRSSEKENRRPNKTDLKESGGIEENSNAIILLHNKADSKNNDYRNNVVNFIDLIIEKNRDGSIGTIPYHFNKDYQRFIECKWENGTMTQLELKPIPQKDMVEIDESQLPF